MAAQPSLRAFRGSDRFLVNRWLGEAHVVAWFGSRAIAEAELAMAQASPSALVRVINYEGAAIGYAQALDCALIAGPRASALGNGTYLATAFIGDLTRRGQGLGAAALGLLRDDVFATTLAPSVACLVPVRRERAVRALERQAFQWREIWHDGALGPCWVLTASRAG